MRCSGSTLKRDKVDIVAAHIARSLVNGAEESDQEEATDTCEKSDTDQDYDESDNKATSALIRRMIKTVIRTIMRRMILVTMRFYKSVTSCVLPNLVEHAGHGKQDIPSID